MTEEEWLVCDNPTPMLNFARSFATERKLRLFAVACLRSQEHLLSGRIRHGIEVAERVADNPSEEERLDIRSALRRIQMKGRRSCTGADVVQKLLQPQADGLPVAFHAAYRARDLEAGVPVAWTELVDRPHPHQADLLREVFGPLPFRPPTLDPAWQTPTVVALATTIYEDRAFDRLGILADALQDAGGDEAELLCHLRGSGPHVRGCWALDLVLGKE